MNGSRRRFTLRNEWSHSVCRLQTSIAFSTHRNKKAVLSQGEPRAAALTQSMNQFCQQFFTSKIKETRFFYLHNITAEIVGKRFLLTKTVGRIKKVKNALKNKNRNF